MCYFWCCEAALSGQLIFDRLWHTNSLDRYTAISLLKLIIHWLFNCKRMYRIIIYLVTKRCNNAVTLAIKRAMRKLYLLYRYYDLRSDAIYARIVYKSLTNMSITTTELIINWLPKSFLAHLRCKDNYCN